MRQRGNAERGGWAAGQFGDGEIAQIGLSVLACYLIDPLPRCLFLLLPYYLLLYNLPMHTSLIIQAGGESRRMGQNKALLPFLGRPLIQRVIERVKAFGEEVLITTNQPEDFAFLGLPCFPDVYPGQGALSGLYTALSAAGYPLVGVVACDMPFANPDLLRAELDVVLKEGVDGAVPRSEEGYEPFHAVYRRETCLPAVLHALEVGQKRLISWFPDVRLAFMTPEQIIKVDPTGLAFLNLNTPDELNLAEQRARKSQSADGTS
ncbi:MAG: molybdenum cofactor guanylyltransferase [Anaerolineaceae bacterium]|nr:molybdenum cofactor guanylyltransferase [Anaerolineaceae bacterium]